MNIDLTMRLTQKFQAAFNTCETLSVRRRRLSSVGKKGPSIEHSDKQACRWIARLCRRFILAADISIRAVAVEIGGCEPKSTRDGVALFLFSSSLLLLSSTFHYLVILIKLDASSQLKNSDIACLSRCTSEKSRCIR